MVGTLVLTGGLLGMLDVIKNGKTRDVKEKWKMSMTYAGVKNKSESEQTFELLKVIKKSYGFDCIVSIPYGKSYEDLEKLLPIIQTNMKCVCVTMDWKKIGGCAYVRLITEEWDSKTLFEPIKVKPYEVFLGTTEYFQDVVSDLRYHPHVIISGSTGMGKSVLMFSMILNSIINNKPSDLQLYLAQVSDKKDLRVFSDVEHVKYYADNLEKSAKMYAYLVDEMDKRNSLINKTKGVNDIGEYNKKMHKNYPYIMTCSDEFAFYMPDVLDTPQEAGYKTICLSHLSRLAKQGRSAGIFLIVGLQRPDKENMPPIFKSLLNTRIAFAQNNTASSLVVVDDGSAVDLQPREAIVLIGNKRHKIRTSYLDMDIIREYIERYETTDDHYVNIDTYTHTLKDAGKVGSKTIAELKQQNGVENGSSKSKKEKNKNTNNTNNNNKENKESDTPSSVKGEKGVVDLCLLKEIDKF